MHSVPAQNKTWKDSNVIQKNGDVISEPQGKSQLILTSMFYNTTVNAETSYQKWCWLTTLTYFNDKYNNISVI